MLKRSLSVVCVFMAINSVQAQGQYTGITGYWDYQTNYRTPQYIRACPNSSMIHAIMMVADDSLNTSASRGTAYAFSSNGGTTWNTFGQIRVPPRRSGYPSLDIGQGSLDCAAIIANHSSISGGALQSTIYVDFPAGGGAFAEIAPPPSLGGDEPGFPETAGTADGSVVLFASKFAAGSVHNTRTSDFISWQPWGALTLDFTSDGFVAEADPTNRVGVVVNTPGDAITWYESTNNGITWPATPTQLLPDLIPSGSDTFITQQGLDLIYLDGDTLVTFGVTKLISGNPTERYQGIGFWSRSTGFILAAPHTLVSGVVDTLRKRQTNQHTIGYPAIGLSGPNIVIAFQAFMPETSQTGFNYSDIFVLFSTNRGTTWSHPINQTHTPTVDERYVSMSKWNPDHTAYLVFQEDLEPGSAILDGAPMARTKQKFLNVQLPLVSVGGNTFSPKEFGLSQNYPNPFNPETRIKFQVPTSTIVNLKVYDVLGREVATLVNETRPPGAYEAFWNASTSASGVYYYRLAAASHLETKRMLLIR